MADIFSGIGDLIGGSMASSAINSAASAGTSGIGNYISQGEQLLWPYNQQGQSFLAPISNILQSGSTGSQNIGVDRINADVNPVDFENFAKNYQMSPGAQYLLSTGAAAQDATAAARGGLLSGANVRAQTGIAEGIANTDLLSQYQAMLQGQQQDFTQRETSFQNLYGQEALGETAAGQGAQLYGQGASALASMYAAQMAASAKASQSKGSGIGGILGGIGSAAIKAFA